MESQKTENQGSADDAQPALRSARREVRAQRRQKMGYLLVAGQSRPVACSIRDFSECQATLAVAGWMGIPDQFVLFVEPDGLKFDCDVVSRSGASVTVRLRNGVTEARPRARSAA